MTTYYPDNDTARAAVENSLVLDPEVAWRPDPPRPTPSGCLTASVTTDTGVRVEVTIPADHELLPDLLARRATRIRSVAPGVRLPRPTPDPRTPLSALLPEHRPTPETTACFA